MSIHVNKEFLVERRKKLGLSQADVAWRVREVSNLNMTHTHYSRVENGVIVATLETAMALAYVLRCDIHDIYTFTPEKELGQLGASPSQKEEFKKEFLQERKKMAGQKLKEARLAKKVRLSDISDYLGVHDPYIYVIEKGGASASKMRKYAQFLGVSLKELDELEDS